MEQIRQAHGRMLTVDGYVGAGGGARFISLMKAGGLDAAFFVVSVPQGEPTPEAYSAVRAEALGAIRRIRRMAGERPRLMSFARAPQDAYRLEKEGRHAAYIGLENGYALGTDLSLVSEYHKEGVRYLALCGNSSNAICDSVFDQSGSEDGGLSDFGRRVVTECNRVGMIIDVAGCSERSVFEALDASRAPVIVSRMAARALCGRPENFTDEMIRAVAKRGGVIMVSFEPERLVARDRGTRASTEDVADHIEHIVKIAGIDCVGIGSGFGKGGGVSGLRDPGEIMNLTLELLRRGLGEYEVESIWGGNAMRVFKEADGLAGER